MTSIDLMDEFHTTFRTSNFNSRQFLGRAMSVGRLDVVQTALDAGVAMESHALEEAARCGQREAVQATMHLLDDNSRQEAIRWAALNNHRDICLDLMNSLTTPLKAITLQWGIRGQNIDIIHDMLERYTFDKKSSEEEIQMLRSVCDSTPEIFQLLEHKITNKILDFGFAVATRQGNQVMFDFLFERVQPLMDSEDWGRLISSCMSKKSAKFEMIKTMADLSDEEHLRSGWSAAVQNQRLDLIDLMMEKIPQHWSEVVMFSMKIGKRQSFEHLWRKAQERTQYFHSSEQIKIMKVAFSSENSDFIDPIFQAIDWDQYGNKFLKQTFGTSPGFPYIQRIILEREVAPRASSVPSSPSRKM